MKFDSIAIEDKVFPHTLNVEWWKAVGEQFRNSALNGENRSVNNSDLVLLMWPGVKKNKVGEKRS